MATVQLSGMWVHDDRQPTLDWRHLRAMTALTRTTQVAVTSMVSASGRLLSRRRPGAPSTWQAQIQIGRDDADWLRARVGRRLMWRDYAGHVLWAVASSLPESEFYNIGNRLVDVTVDLDEVDAPWPVGPDD